MSEEISCRDKCKLNHLLEQVNILSCVVDELRTEVNDLKKMHLDVDHGNVCFDSTKEKNNQIESNVVEKVKTYCRNIGISAKTEETRRFTQSIKIINRKIIGSIRKIQDFQKKPEHTCVISDRQKCFLRKDKKLLDSDTCKKNERTDVSEGLDINSRNILFIRDASTQTEIATCSCQKDLEKLFDRSVTNNVSTDLSGNSPMNDARNETSPRNKIKRYKRCSCGEQCLYAMYKLPCNKYKCDMPETRANDEADKLALECTSFREKNNFPTFISVDTVRKSKNGCFANSSSAEIGLDEDSSLSVDLEVRVCHDRSNYSRNVSKFSRRRRARMYILSRTNTRKNDDIIKPPGIDNVFFSNAILSQADAIDRKN